MQTPLDEKSSIDKIRARFDADVDRFSHLDTGQTATVDAPLAMELITQAAVASTIPIRRVLDLGCGAGNNTVKLRQVLGADFASDLLDLSQPMLDRANERVAAVNQGTIRTIAGDFREAYLEPSAYDVALAAAVLHHLRADDDWTAAFEKIYRVLAPGGSVWITDLVSHEISTVQDLMWARYADYLTALSGEAYKEQSLCLYRQRGFPAAGHLPARAAPKGRVFQSRPAA